MLLELKTYLTVQSSTVCDDMSASILNILLIHLNFKKDRLLKYGTDMDLTCKPYRAVIHLTSARGACKLGFRGRPIKEIPEH